MSAFCHRCGSTGWITVQPTGSTSAISYAKPCPTCAKQNAPINSASDHGPTCADTPIDHHCGDTEEDQGVTWSQALKTMSERCRLIASYHHKAVYEGGGTDGYCVECETVWPCRTYHIAAGWGQGDECWADHWCDHAKVTVR